MKPSLATQVRSLGLPDRLVRAVEEVQQLLRVGAGVLPGDKAGQWITRGDLIQWGFATEPGGGMPLVPAGPPGTPGGGAEAPDYTPPPTPENVQAIGGYTSIFVVWDAVRDRRIGYFEVWRASVDDIGQAVKIGQTTSFQYIDEVQNSARYYYWVRSVNAWDDAIVSPFNAVAGTMGETAPNASYVLELLTGQITESQLHADLGSRIDLIDADESVAGSVGARIKATQTTLENADAVLAQQMMTLSAGIGDQFDPFTIWYFDSSIDGWGGNGTPTASGGWIRPADHATDAYLTSPINVNVPASTYPQVKLRIKRVGAPTWEGALWWRLTASTWDIGNRLTFDEPAFDADGIAVVTVNVPWTGTVNGIRLDLSSSSSSTDHYALDWVAIGRPAPGASVIALQQEATVRASETGSLFAKYTVKIDANGYVSGFGLASTANNATPFSEFAVRADRFSIASPSGPGITPVVPFAVQTTPTTIDGITFQPGVYMTQAVIKKAIVENFVAGLAVIDDASIKNVRAGKILADKLGVGQYIESQGYIAGSTGWRINAAGRIEAFDVTLRGSIRSGGFTGYAWPSGSATGYYIGPEGALFGNPALGQYFVLNVDGSVSAPGFSVSGGNASFQGHVNATSGLFSGSLNAATGTFSGSLSGATGLFAGTLAAGVLNSSAFDSIAYAYSSVGTYGLSIPSRKAGWTAMALRVTVVGAGGGGGGGWASGRPTTDPWSSGGGGGAGAKQVYTIASVTTGQALTVAVGAGGGGGAGSLDWDGSRAANPGGAGGTSYVNGAIGYYPAAGGNGGGGGSHALAVVSRGGAGGSMGGASGGGGTLGGAGLGSSGGNGGSSQYGAGGAGGIHTGYHGAAYPGGTGGVAAGGGGGGSGLWNTDNAVAAGGGGGGSGYVLLEFYDPNTVVLNNRYSKLVEWLDTIGHGSVPGSAR